MSGKFDRKQGNREKLLQAALDCLRDKGYARTTARDLVAVSGTNLASIGYHFGSKEALLSEAIAMGFRAWTAEVERATFASEAASTAERLERSLAAMIDRFGELRPFLVSFVEAFPPAVRSPELREGMADAYEEARSAGAEMILRAARADGVLLDREYAETLCSVLMAIGDGLILQWLLHPNRVPSSRQVMEALAAAAPPSSASHGRRASATPRKRCDAGLLYEGEELRPSGYPNAPSGRVARRPSVGGRHGFDRCWDEDAAGTPCRGSAPSTGS
jgi:AcrR family transcriptional regulator